MPLPSDLLNPISADKPSGENLQYAPIYDKIKEARREDDDTPQGDWARGRKLADWSLTVKLITEALSTKTKDLQLTAWLAEAMLKREGINGLREVLELDRAYIENFWDSLYPELEDGDAEFRAGKLQWVGDKLEQAVKQVPLTRTGLNWNQYRESRTVGSEEAADTDEKQRARREAIAEGKIPLEQFDKDFDAAPKTFYVNLEAAFDATLESLSLLGETCDAKFGNVSPGFGTLRSVLEEVRQTVHSLLQRKREKEPDAPVDVPAAEVEAVEETPVEEVEAPTAVTVARAAPVRRGALSAEPVDRQDAVSRIVASAKFFARKIRLFRRRPGRHRPARDHPNAHRAYRAGRPTLATAFIGGALTSNRHVIIAVPFNLARRTRRTVHDHRSSSVPDACRVRLEEKEYHRGALPAPSLSR